MGVSDKLMIELNPWIMPHNLSWGTESPKTKNAMQDYCQSTESFNYNAKVNELECLSVYSHGNRQR